MKSLRSPWKNSRALCTLERELLSFLAHMGALLLSRVQLFVTPWTVAWQAPLSMEFSRQEYWSGLLFPSPGDLPDPGIELRSSALQEDIYIYMKKSLEHQE